MARVTGIGGVFFQSSGEGKALAEWYRKNLGMEPEAFGGVVLKWPQDTAEDLGATVWHVTQDVAAWFAPSKSNFMINYRVDDMDGIIALLRENGTPIHQGPESHENGRFMWVIDPDGNKVELWEPKIWDDKNKKS